MIEARTTSETLCVKKKEGTQNYIKHYIRRLLDLYILRLNTFSVRWIFNERNRRL